jgi:hypothetical protein
LLAILKNETSKLKSFIAVSVGNRKELENEPDEALGRQVEELIEQRKANGMAAPAVHFASVLHFS